MFNKIGNAYGVAGLMGNLEAESGLRANNLQDSYESKLGFTDESYTSAVDNGTYSEDKFVHDDAGYGLAQWTYYTRKQGLYNLYKTGYSSIGDLSLALEYLWYELQTTYKGVLNVLKNANSVKEASDKVLHDFENPAEQSESVEIYREKLSQSYYDRFSGGTIEPEPPTPPVKTTSRYRKNKMPLWMMLPKRIRNGGFI